MGTTSTMIKPSRNREEFLHAPSDKIIAAWNEPELTRVGFSTVYEALCSTWIENEEDSQSLREAFVFTAYRYVTTLDLLYWHASLMEGKKFVYPGRLRPVNVRVGDYIAPEWQKVPDLMAEFDEFMLSDAPTLLKVVWGHLQFETIHPFADGNGRLGRMFVAQILNRPFAPAVLNQRWAYYHLLNQGNWNEWQHWMLSILQLAPVVPLMRSNPWKIGRHG